MQTFNEINLNKDLNKAIAELGFIKPTPIQAKTIPILMDSDQDMIGSAQTGTGKTAAFGLPSIHLTNLDEPGTQTLILCPTRELCMQVANDLRAYSKYIDKLGIVSIYGGASIEKQIKSIKKRSHIVVGTPGRTKDLLTRKKLFIDKVQRIVLDEADEMLSMGFKDDLDFILSKSWFRSRSVDLVAGEVVASAVVISDSVWVVDDFTASTMVALVLKEISNIIS